jgi:hypothetical protein
MVAGTASHVRVATGAIKKKLAVIFREEDYEREFFCMRYHPSQLADIFTDFGSFFDQQCGEGLTQKATSLACNSLSSQKRGRHLQTSQQVGQCFRAFGHAT